jgi:proline iminopeptidase
MHAKVNGTTIYFDVEGSGYRAHGGEMTSLPVCLVLHGGPGLDHTYFKPWLSPLAEHMQLVYLDHRGNGQSGRAATATYTMEQFADDVEAVREHLGLGKVFVLGNSFGGFISLLFALRHTESVAGLVLSNTAPSGAFAEEMLALVNERATPEQQETLTLLFEGRHTGDAHYRRWWEIMAPYYFASPDSRVMAELVSRLTVSATVANHMFPQEFPKYDLREQLGPLLSVPTLVVGGRHDGVIPVSQSQLLHELIAGSELAVFEDSGHFPFIEEQEGFARRVAGFVAAHSG